MDIAKNSGTHTLYNLQGLRALAACLVLYHHYVAYPQIAFDDWYGAVGVDIFFVISGFVITYARRGEPVDFLVRRFIRIAPLYWLLTLTWVGLALAFRISGSGLTPDSITLPLVLKSLFFIPDQPIITRGWTLNYEMYFYVLFAISMLVSRAYTAIICLAMIAAIFLAVNVANIGRPFNFYGSVHVFQFAMGSGAFYAWREIGRRPTIAETLKSMRSILLCAAILALVACCLSSDFYRDRSLVAATIASGLFVLIIVSLEEYCGLYVHSPLINLLGNASYSIYLVHRFIYAPMARIVFPHLDGQPAWLKLLAFAPICVVVVAGSVLVHLSIEKPMTRILGNLWRKRSGAPKSEATVAATEWTPLPKPSSSTGPAQPEE